MMLMRGMHGLWFQQQSKVSWAHYGAVRNASWHSDPENETSLQQVAV